VLLVNADPIGPGRNTSGPIRVREVTPVSHTCVRTTSVGRASMHQGTYEVLISIGSSILDTIPHRTHSLSDTQSVRRPQPAATPNFRSHP